MKQFHERATYAVEEIRSRGRLPILVGGTQYYIQSLLFPNTLVEDSKSEPPASSQDDGKWRILDASTEAMMDELKKVDPAIANRWHPNDRRKIRRSLEICLRTGRPASQIYSEQANANVETISKLTRSDSQAPSLNDPLIFWTHASSAQLDSRLDRRVDAMMSQGLLDEVISMHSFQQQKQARGDLIDQSRGVWIAIGYKEFLPFLTDGDHSEDLRNEGVERTKVATRQYARRQIRWIRLKLLSAMANAHMAGRLFLLDGTDLSSWSTQVDVLAQGITNTFLNGDNLPCSASFSNLAKEMLVTEEKPQRIARYCEACEKTLMSDGEWARHLKSKGHKSASRPKTNWRALYPRDEEG